MATHSQAPAAQAQDGASPYPQFRIDGEVSTVFERYESNGDGDGTPYPFLEDQAFTEFNLNFQRQGSPYNRIEGTAYGILWDDSQYRGVQGIGGYERSEFLLEQGNLRWERGEGVIPNRGEVGDFFGYFSQRTLQLGLKGGTVELQPKTRTGKVQHSLMGFAGFTAPVWFDLDPEQDLYTGGSYLISHRRAGDISFNYVQNSREVNGDSTAIALVPGHEENLIQRVYSTAAFKEWSFRNHEMSIEGEYAWFEGDRSDALLSRQDQGYFLEFRGNKKDRLTYSLLYERYGKDYSPNGAAVGPDRSALELRLGKRFKRGKHLRLRAQQFIDQLEQPNSSITNLVGFDLSGPFFGSLLKGKPVQGSISGFLQDFHNDYGTSDTLTGNGHASFTARLGKKLTGRLTGTHTTVHDEVTTDYNRSSLGTIGLDRQFQLGNLRGVISPTATLGRTTGPDNIDYTEWSVGGFVSLYGERHGISADYRFYEQDSDFETRIDTYTHNASARYSYERGPHLWELDAELAMRDPAPGQWNGSYKIGGRYTFRFSRARRPAAIPGPGAPGTGPVAPPDGGPFDIAQIRPGMALGEAQAILDRANLGAGVSQLGTLIYETPLIDRVDERQRLVIEHDGQRVLRTVLIIDADTLTSSPTQFKRLFAIVQDHFARKYGAPSPYELGEFTTNLKTDVNDDKFVRLNEWSFGASTVRLGIPNRLDDVVRIEVQHARTFPSPSQTHWSLETVR